MTDIDPALAAWLGDATDTATPDQLEAITEAARAIDVRYPDEDLRDDREAALTGAVQVILGDATLEESGTAWHRARGVETTARATLTGAIIASRNLPETEIGRRSGMSRMSIRKALGKQG